MGDVTAEPRMEDLLASIRKAIHDDIGDAQRLSERRSLPPTLPAVQPRVSDELAAAASEIQQLRDKISRARAAKPAPVLEPAQRAASLAAALQTETPRRNWRDLEPPPPPLAPRLRGSVIETEVARPLPRPEVSAPVPRLTARGDEAGILSDTSAQAVHSAFSKLADSVMSRATNDRSVEEVTRELLRPMLKQWLDENLPAMVERLVREEIERVARSGR